jgi:hypothetical protein
MCFKMLVMSNDEELTDLSKDRIVFVFRTKQSKRSILICVCKKEAVLFYSSCI